MEALIRPPHSHVLEYHLQRQVVLRTPYNSSAIVISCDRLDTHRAVHRVASISENSQIFYLRKILGSKPITNQDQMRYLSAKYFEKA